MAVFRATRETEIDRKTLIGDFDSLEKAIDAAREAGADGDAHHVTDDEWVFMGEPVMGGGDPVEWYWITRDPVPATGAS